MLLSRWANPRKRLPAKNQSPKRKCGVSLGVSPSANPAPPRDRVRGAQQTTLCFFRHRRTACRPPPCGYCQGAGRGRQNGAPRGLSTRKSKRGGKFESQSQSRGRKSAVAASTRGIRRWPPSPFWPRLVHFRDSLLEWMRRRKKRGRVSGSGAWNPIVSNNSGARESEAVLFFRDSARGQKSSYHEIS